ncbi:hypothetical protein R75465_07151 [Paraburkholderia aspalathi]|uniref:DUF7706 family protein n=1 Tax=Paraburkholderia aspalathi TaxID=1324617 RepID=UPI001B081D41|nr:hypothetical protein [Paraburkholderia aspalathi]CAE6850742.1 hypothetical protein R75465_07151 [Paraburkholderia aspalathi]
MKPFSIDAEMTDAQAWAFSEFLKRAALADYRELAKNDGEAYEMMAAGEALRRGLARQGYSPR